MLRRNPDPAPARQGVTPEAARDARIADGARRLAQAHNQAVTATSGTAGVLRKPAE